MIRQWVSKPLLDVGIIRQRQQGVQLLFTTGMLRAELRAALRQISDLERLTTRLVSGTAQPRDLVGLRGTLQRLPGIRKIFDDASSALKESGIGSAHIALSDVLNQFEPCDDELQILELAMADDPPATLQNTGVIKSGYSAELDGVIERSRHA
jgi:DNA mismatch repair protein MutS